MQEARWTPKAGCELPTRRAQIRRQMIFFSLIVTFVLGAEIICGGRTVRNFSGRRLGPQVAVLEGGGPGGGEEEEEKEEAEARKKKQNLHTG